MIRKDISLKWKITLAVMSVVFLFSLYGYVSHQKHLNKPNDRTLPTFSQLWEGIEELFELDEQTGGRMIVDDSKATFTRFFTGMFLACIAGMFIGTLMGTFAVIEWALIVPLTFFANVPWTAALGVLFVMVATGNQMCILMVFLGVLPVFAQSVYLSIKDVPMEYIDKARTLGASTAENIVLIIFAQTVPKIINSVRLQIGPALVYLIAGEWVSAHVGYGYVFRMKMQRVDMRPVYPYIFILAVFGFLMFCLCKLLVRKLTPWYQRGG